MHSQEEGPPLPCVALGSSHSSSTRVAEKDLLFEVPPLAATSPPLLRVPPAPLPISSSSSSSSVSSAVLPATGEGTVVCLSPPPHWRSREVLHPDPLASSSPPHDATVPRPPAFPWIPLHQTPTRTRAVWEEEVVVVWPQDGHVTPFYPFPLPAISPLVCPVLPAWTAWEAHGTVAVCRTSVPQEDAVVEELDSPSASCGGLSVTEQNAPAPVVVETSSAPTTKKEEEGKGEEGVVRGTEPFPSPMPPSAFFPTPKKAEGRRGARVTFFPRIEVHTYPIEEDASIPRPSEGPKKRMGAWSWNNDAMETTAKEERQQRRRRRTMTTGLLGSRQEESEEAWKGMDDGGKRAGPFPPSPPSPDAVGRRTCAFIGVPASEKEGEMPMRWPHTTTMRRDGKETHPGTLSTTIEGTDEDELQEEKQNTEKGKGDVEERQSFSLSYKRAREGSVRDHDAATEDVKESPSSATENTDGFSSGSLPFQPFVASVDGQDTLITVRFLEHFCSEEMRNADQERFGVAHKEAVALLASVTQDLEGITFHNG